MQGLYLGSYLFEILSGMTVAYDLAIAVLIGVIFSALSYVWQSAQHIYATITYDESKDLKTYKLREAALFWLYCRF